MVTFGFIKEVNLIETFAVRSEVAYNRIEQFAKKWVVG